LLKVSKRAILIIKPQPEAGDFGVLGGRETSSQLVKIETSRETRR